MTAAKRGDLAAIVTESHDYVIGEGARVRTSVELGVVTSITRDGVVRKVRTPYGETDLTRPYRGRSVRVVAAATIDVDAACAAYAERRYPSAPDHSTMAYPFSNVDEARAFLRPFLHNSPVST